jgi:peptidoglycan/xylan/chitin deacetylase (PgdA/CDA1 family)
MQVMCLDNAIKALYSGTLPANALVITIDDGFHSVHRLAAPLLRQHGLPATVYVTTYYVERPNPIFRLAVQYMFWKSRADSYLPPDDIGTTGERFDLSDPAQRERAAWSVIRHGETGCTEDQRHALSGKVGRQLRVPYEDIVQGRALHLMTPAELNTLADFGLTVELHTHRHVFPDDDSLAAKREIEDNRATLRRLMNRAPDHFCYPSGLWTEQQWGWLDAMGVRTSSTCVPGLNSRDTPRHALRRFLDGANIHQVEFEAALCGFSDLLRGLRGRLVAPLHHTQPPGLR